MSEDKDKAPERIWRTTNGYIYKGPTPEPCVEYVRADLLATARKEGSIAARDRIVSTLRDLRENFIPVNRALEIVVERAENGGSDG